MLEAVVESMDGIMFARQVQKSRIICALTLWYCTSTVAVIASEVVEVSLQDTVSSPSDIIVPVAPVQTPAQAQIAPLNTAPLDRPRGGGLAQQLESRPQTQPRSPAPQIATLGNQNYNSLVNSNMYASPLLNNLVGSSTGSSGALNRYFGSSAHGSLLKTPEMFGDFRRPGPALTIGNAFLPPSNTSREDNRPLEIPSAASYSGLRISENNYALPQDRVWFAYNHMHNAFAQPGGDISLDRFTFAIEKTLFGGTTSAELRLPLVGSLDAGNGINGEIVYSGGNYGNLSVILKRVLYADDQRVWSYGLGIEMPTGSTVQGVQNAQTVTSIQIEPNSVYLTPYLGAMRTFDDIWYAHGFLQIDVPTSGERLVVASGGNVRDEYQINSPTLLEIDLGGGVWLIAPDRCRPVGLAYSSELHIATAVSEVDSFSSTVLPGGRRVDVNSQNSVQNIVNLTNGLHATLRQGWSLRSGIVVPLLEQRIFDTEVFAQVNCRF
jgi:hypothetical protein